MKIEMEIKDIEYKISKITGKELSLLQIALLEKIKKENEEGEHYFFLQKMIDEIGNIINKADKL